jgi:hypothetical protein
MIREKVFIWEVGFYTQIWPDEANRLKHRALDKLDVESTYSSNRSFDEVDQSLDAPLDAMNFSIMLPALNKGELDHKLYWNIVEESEIGSDEVEKKGWDRLRKYVDRKLGPDWVAYRSAVGLGDLWPSGLAIPPYGGSKLAQECRQWQFKLGLYGEFRETLNRSSVSVSGFSAGNYYRLLAGRDNPSAHLRRLVSRKYEATLRAKLEEVDYLCLDLEMPPILRLCLRDSHNVEGGCYKSSDRIADASLVCKVTWLS